MGGGAAVHVRSLPGRLTDAGEVNNAASPEKSRVGADLTVPGEAAPDVELAAVQRDPLELKDPNLFAPFSRIGERQGATGSTMDGPL